MVCKEEICNWFQYIQSYERIDLLCKLLHLCSSHELRFIASIVEDHARKDFSTLRDSTTKANNAIELKKLCPNLFKAADRSAMLVYLSLLDSNNTVCSHALFNQLTRIESQRLACHLHSNSTHNPGAEQPPGIGIIDSDIADDVVLLYTMAAYHPAFSISQRLQLSDYLQKAQTYLSEYLSKSEPVDCEERAESPPCSSHGNPNAGCMIQCNSLSQNPTQSQNNAIKRPVHVKSAQLKRQHNDVFVIQVTWSSGEVTEISRTYQQIHTFHVELLRLFPKDSGAHRQERHIPYLPQEKGGQIPSEEHIDKYIRQLSALPDHIIQCGHVTNFFGMNNQLEVEPMFDHIQGNRQNRQSSECEEIMSAMDPNLISNGEEICVNSNLAVPTAHAVTTVVQQRISYSSVVVSPMPHNSPLPSPLSSPHVSPSQLNKQGGLENITAWLKNLRLHKYANLNKYSWQQVCMQLSQLSDADLEKEGLTDGAKKKFHKELNSQLQKMGEISTKNGLVNSPRIRQDSSLSGSIHSMSPTHSCETPTPSPTPNSGCQNMQSTLSPNHGLVPHHPPVHLPLAIMTRISYSNSIGSTNSIGSCSPGLSDSSSFTPPSSPRSHGNVAPIVPGSHVMSQATPLTTAWAHPSSDTGENSDENVPSAFNNGVAIPTNSNIIGLKMGEMIPFPSPGPAGDGPGPGPGLGPMPGPPQPPGPVSMSGPVPSPMPGPIPGPPVPGSYSGLEGSDTGLAPGAPCMPHMLPIRMPAPCDNGMPMPVHPMTIRPRTPLNAQQMRLPGNHYMGQLIPVHHPVTAPPQPSPCVSHNGLPEANHQGILMTKSCSQPPPINQDMLPVNIPAENNSKPPMNYPVLPPPPGMMARIPSLMGPVPACHMVPRPNNLGVPSTSVTYTCVSTPGHGSSHSVYDKVTQVHLPPTNIPPPNTMSSQGISMPFHGVASCSVTYSTGTAFTPTSPTPVSNQSGNGLLPTPPGSHTPQPANTSVSISPSPPGTLVHPTPTQTPTTVPTPVPQPLPPPHNALTPSECTCRCNCPQCTGHSPQPQQPPPQMPPIPTTLQFNYHPPLSWQQTPMFPGSYPLPGGLIPVSSNGLVNHNINFPPFSSHVPQSPFSNLHQDMLYEARHYALLQAASQGLPHALHHPLHYPMMHGGHPNMHHFGNNSKPHRSIMCYNCGQSGHMAHDCKAPTMENLTGARFQLNIQPRTEAD